MSKWWRLAVRLGLLLLGNASGVRAVDWSALKPQGCISDFADVLDAAGKSSLETYCKAVEQATGGQITLVVVPSLEGEPVEEVASAIYRAWGVGSRGQQTGILFLLTVQDQRSRLEIGPRLKAILPGSLDGSVLAEMRPALREGQYGEAMMAAAETIGGSLASARHTIVNASLPRRIHPGAFDWIPWPVVIGGFLLLLWLMRLMRAGWPRGYGASRGGAMARSTWGSNGRGGFGGYDSGDGGVGAFGGGDTAGFAASDW